MKGIPEIIALLNEVLAGELVAINQYFLHAKMCSNWGYRGLASRTRDESIEEMKHAELLTERILFLDGLPNLQRLDKLNIGETVIEQLKSDLGLELRAVELLNRGIELCRQRGDHGSEALLTHILQQEEEHIDWLEAQLTLVEQVGEQNYLTEQMRKE